MYKVFLSSEGLERPGLGKTTRSAARLSVVAGICMSAMSFIREKRELTTKVRKGEESCFSAWSPRRHGKLKKGL